MKVLHLNAGNETGGGMIHILSLLNELNRDEFILGLFEREQFYDKAIEYGINTVLFEQNSRLDLSVIFKIVKYIKVENIDIIHTHGARANLLGYIIKILTKVNWMTTIHSDPRNDFLGRGIKGRIFTNINMRVLKKASHFFAISKRFKEMLVNFGINAEHITTIYNGIDFNKNKFKYGGNYREKLKLSEDNFVILMVARFDPVKCHKVAINAVKTVFEDYPNTRLLLVGDGPFKKEMELYVQQNGMSSFVDFLGFKENVHLYYQLADITLLTSKTESFPLVLLESGRESTPVITTDVGGVKDMIPDPSYGFIVPVGDTNAIEKAIKDAICLKKMNKLNKIGTRFNQYISKRFSVEAFAASVYDVYKRTGR
jgi:L-malate glycosyltransferase